VPTEQLTIEPAPPYRLDLTVAALRRRPHNAMDLWDGRIYRRVVVTGGGPIKVAVAQTGPSERPRLAVRLTGHNDVEDTAPAVLRSLDRLLGLRVDLADFYAFAAGDRTLAPLVARFHGFRPPRFPTLFETLLNAIACQQITLTFGIHLLNRLAASFGMARGDPPHVLPCPEDLIEQDTGALRGLGYSGQKARAMAEAAACDLAGRLDDATFATMDDSAAVARLRELHGVGRWTAEYVLLRGLGRLHIFPGDDVGARNNLQRYLGLTGPLDYAGVHQVIAPWRAYGGLIYMHLLLERLAEMGMVMP
jgi:DNA-3-methyladenine glycosylase II